MGKNQHSKDLLHQRPTEWAQDGRGFKQRRKTPFAKLPLDCCSLSLQPFESPVGTREGAVFESSHIIAYIKRYGKNPVTGGRLEVSQLTPLHFHRSADGSLQCPVTYKAFTNSSHVVANMASGHVYSFDAVNELNKKTKNWVDLITSKPFKWSDIVVLQDPEDVQAREVEKFHFMQQGQQDEVVREITNRESEASKEAKAVKIRGNAALDRINDAKRQIAADKEAEAKEEAERKEAAGKLQDELPPSKALEPLEDLLPDKLNERFTAGAVAESFTSTSTPLRTENELRNLTREERLQEIYDFVRKKKQKGYVRLITSEGMLNLELHTDIAPRTADNFLRLCEREYYNDTIFHRLIRNFVMQGGDPTGTGKGGASAFDGGKSFRDEFDSRLTHQGPGVVSMANNGKNTNRSQFFVSLKSCQHLDNKHSIFGRVVGGLQLLTVFNDWETNDKDAPVKEIRLLRTEVFKNPFREGIIELTKPKVEEKVVNPAATWFSNRSDPMEGHKNRNSDEVGKYLEAESVRPLLGHGGKSKEVVAELPPEELEYVVVAQKSKKPRTSFDFSKF